MTSSPSPPIDTSPFDPRLHLRGVIDLFEAAACPCFCRYWHFEGDKNEWLERCSIGHGNNEREFAEAAARGSDEASGVVAIEGDLVVGWAKVAPADRLAKLRAQRYYRGLPQLVGDRPGAHAIGCMLVRPSHRRRGVGVALARAAVAFARDAGARWLEAFPRVVTAPVADEELWMSTHEALLAAGFQAWAGEAPYPVLRHDLAR